MKKKLLIVLFIFLIITFLAAVLYFGFLFICARQEIVYQGSDQALISNEEHRLIDVMGVISDTYTQTGLLINSMHDLQRTYYYPYTEDFSSPNKLQIRISIYFGKVFISGCLTNAIKMVDKQDSWFKKLSPLDITTKKMKWYCSGIVNITKYSNENRRSLMEIIEHERKFHHDINNYYTIRLFPPSPIKELPHNQKELYLYLKWLQKVENQKQLVDGWGRPLTFSIANGFLICRSNGPDGKPGSKDKIELKVPLNRK